MPKPGQYGNRSKQRHRNLPPTGRPRRKKGGGLGALTDPTTLLSGKRLKKGANALTRLELLPALRAYGREASALEAQRRGAEQGLYGLQSRTGAAVGGAYDALRGSSAQTQARQAAIAGALNQQTQQIGQQAQQNLTAAQTGELGDLTHALASQNIEPGGSASQAALAQQVQQQQQAASQRATASSTYANQLGGSFQGLAAAQGQAEQMRGREAQSAIAQAIADRIASSNADYGADIREAYGKRADTKALFGPTRLKNLLQLRGSEREYGLAVNPPTKTSNVNNRYFGLSKKAKISANAQKQVAKTQQETQALKNQGFKNLPSGGGGKKKRRPRRP